MEEKEPEVVTNGFKQFAIMWGQTASVFGLIILSAVVIAAVVLGVAAMFKFAGPIIGAIVFFVVATFGITAWGWFRGDRP